MVPLKKRATCFRQEGFLVFTKGKQRNKREFVTKFVGIEIAITLI